MQTSAFWQRTPSAGQRGFVLSSDAMISLTLFFFLVMVSFFYISQISVTAWDAADLLNAVRDQATVLEKSGALDSAVQQGSSQAVLDMLNSTPGVFCFEVSVFDPANFQTPVLHSIKSDCTKSYSTLMSTERSMVVRQNAHVSFYVARVDGWFK